MRRREFITLLSGGVLLPQVARAQGISKIPRLGFLGVTFASSWASRSEALQLGLRNLGYEHGQNIVIEDLWAEESYDHLPALAAEFVPSQGRYYLDQWHSGYLSSQARKAHGGATVAPLLQATLTVPIVFPVVADPVGAGFVDNLARPGGNATGFMNLEYGLAGKWLELLKEIVPGVKRAAIIHDTANPTGIAMFGIIQAMAPSLGMEVIPINLRDAGEFERSVAAFARVPNGGLVVTPSAPTVLHRNLIVTLAARHKLPAVYFERTFAAAGGWSPMEPTSSINTGKRLTMLIAFSRARSQLRCPCRRRPSINW